jgi:GMP synthase-like glutamine amidotransferase
MTKVIAFQHTKNEPLGYIETLLDGWEIPFDYVPLWETNELPANKGTHLVFLGGPMSVHDGEEFPFLAKEKELIRRSVKNKVPVLGLCLGAQLIASAYGVPVYRFVNETGWFPVTRTDESTKAFEGFPGTFMAFQFHSDTFLIPPGGKLLCRGNVVRHQAFQYKSALALQFHLEMTQPLIDDWTCALRPSLKEKIRRDTGLYLERSNRLCQNLLARFLASPDLHTTPL